MTTSSPYGQPANLDPYATGYAQPVYPGAGQAYATGYAQPYGPYVAPKSKATAALLAFFLGTLGVHNFYRGQLGRGFGHIALAVATVACAIVTLVMEPDTANSTQPTQVIAWLLCIANWIWMIVDFILILVSEDGSLQ